MENAEKLEIENYIHTLSNQCYQLPLYNIHWYTNTIKAQIGLLSLENSQSWYYFHLLNDFGHSTVWKQT